MQQFRQATCRQIHLQPVDSSMHRFSAFLQCAPFVHATEFLHPLATSSSLMLTVLTGARSGTQKRLLLQALPLKRPAQLLCYGISAGLVSLAFLIRLDLDEHVVGMRYLLFFPAVVIATLLFNYSAGLFASVLSGILSTYFLEQPHHFWVGEISDWVSLAIFIMICVMLTTVIEGLRRSLDQIALAGREKDLMLREINHRISNDFQRMATLLTLEQSTADARAQGPLARALERIYVLGRVYQRLARRETPANVVASIFLEGLGEDIQEAHIGNRPIIIEVTAANAVIDLKCATELGLIINELVTNCLKHAFPANQEGRIDVSFCREYEEYVLIIQDNGIGIPAAEQSACTGLGWTLVHQLVDHLSGTLTFKQEQGTAAIIRFPATRAHTKAKGVKGE
jgi:two-component sensor histidine kinase